jgi:hypothetical protein
METIKQIHPPPTRKKVFFQVLAFTLVCIPLAYIIFESISLLTGHQSVGHTISNAHTPIKQLFNFYFSEYILEVVMWFLFLLIGCFSFGIITSIGGCIIFPFAPLIVLIVLSGIFSFLMTKAVFWINKVEGATRILKWCFWSILAMYAMLFVTHIIVTSVNEGVRSTQEQNFKETYTFDTLNPSTKFLYFDWNTGSFRKVNLTVANLDGSNKKVLSEITLPIQAGRPTPGFPSPKGTYYISSATESDSFEGYVKTLDGTNVYTIPDIFYNYTQGVAQWSTNERYLAIFSKKVTYHQAPGHLIVYDLKLKRPLFLFDGGDYGAFTWADNDTLYYACGEHLCDTRFFDATPPISKTLANTIDCSGLLFLNDKVYCSAHATALEKVLGKKMPVPNMPFVDRGLLGDSYIIAQDIRSDKPLQKIVEIITKIPLSSPKTLTAIDSEHITVSSYTTSYASAGLHALLVVDIKNGRLMDLGLIKNNVFAELATRINVGDLPVVYRGN